MSHGFRQGLWNSKSVNLFTLMCFKTIVTGSQFCSVTNGCQNIYVSQNTAQVKTGLKSEVNIWGWTKPLVAEWFEKK